MIPGFDANTGNLPPGIHAATWAEITDRFVTSPYRERLLRGLLAGLRSLRLAGCTRVYIDGSFVSSKEAPNDFDVCWEPAGVDFGALDRIEPFLLLWSNQRFAQRAKFGGEFFLANAPADRLGTPFLEYFQRDKRKGQQKGIVALDLGGLP